MFKITPIQEKTLQERCATACGTKFIPDSFGYMMSDAETGDLMGFSQFTINSDSGYIYDLKSKIGYSDFEAMFILGRATLNFIDFCDTHTCKASIEAADERLMKCIGFKMRVHLSYRENDRFCYNSHTVFVIFKIPFRVLIF